MVQRVVGSEVKERVLEIDSSFNTQPFIETANLIVEEDLAGEGMTDARLKQIELYLTAHLIILSTQRVEEETLPDGMRFKYAGPPLGEGLNSTVYGQQVKSLDTSGKLARQSIGVRASLRVD
jgi:hypothetical protein